MTSGELGQVIVGFLGAFIGPLLAIWITQRLWDRRRHLEGKMQILKTLLASRHFIGDPAFSVALNLARVEFADAPRVIKALDTLVQATNSPSPDPTAADPDAITGPLLAVIEEMARSVGLNIAVLFGNRAPCIGRGAFFDPQTQ